MFWPLLATRRCGGSLGKRPGGVGPGRREGRKERGFVWGRAPARQRQRPPATSHRGGTAPPSAPHNPQTQQRGHPGDVRGCVGTAGPTRKDMGCWRRSAHPLPTSAAGMSPRCQDPGAGEGQPALTLCHRPCRGCATVPRATSYSRTWGSHGHCVPLGTRGPLSKRRDPHGRHMPYEHEKGVCPPGKWFGSPWCWLPPPPRGSQHAGATTGASAPWQGHVPGDGSDLTCQSPCAMASPALGLAHGSCGQGRSAAWHPPCPAWHSPCPQLPPRTRPPLLQAGRQTDTQQEHTPLRTVSQDLGVKVWASPAHAGTWQSPGAAGAARCQGHPAASIPRGPTAPASPAPS